MKIPNDATTVLQKCSKISQDSDFERNFIEIGEAFGSAWNGRRIILLIKQIVNTTFLTRRLRKG